MGGATGLSGAGSGLALNGLESLALEGPGASRLRRGGKIGGATGLSAGWGLPLDGLWSRLGFGRLDASGLRRGGRIIGGRGAGSATTALSFGRATGTFLCHRPPHSLLRHPWCARCCSVRIACWDYVSNICIWVNHGGVRIVIFFRFVLPSSPRLVRRRVALLGYMLHWKQVLE